MQQDLPFNERGITFARAGLSASGQLFRLRDLRGATVVMVPRQKPLPIALGVIGLIVAVTGGIFGSGPAVVLGGVIAVAGYFSLITQDVIYRMYVKTPEAEGEVIPPQAPEVA